MSSLICFLMRPELFMRPMIAATAGSAAESTFNPDKTLSLIQ